MVKTEPVIRAPFQSHSSVQVQSYVKATPRDLAQFLQTLSFLTELKKDTASFVVTGDEKQLTFVKKNKYFISSVLSFCVHVSSSK